MAEQVALVRCQIGRVVVKGQKKEEQWSLSSQDKSYKFLKGFRDGSVVWFCSWHKQIANNENLRTTIVGNCELKMRYLVLTKCMVRENMHLLTPHLGYIYWKWSVLSLCGVFFMFLHWALCVQAAESFEEHLTFSKFGCKNLLFYWKRS